MKEKLLNIGKLRSIYLSCIVGVIISVIATAFVMIFLKGSKSDLIALIIIPYFLLIRALEKPFPKVAKMLMSYATILGPIIIIVSNSGHYGATDQTYFLCLIMSLRHYDVGYVFRTASTTLITNIIGFLLFPEPYLKIHNLTVWIFVLFTYVVAAICALIIADRTHNLFEKERQLQIYQCELLHLQQLEKKNEEHNKFIHNMHHYLSAIGNLASKQDCENILSILTDMNVEINKQHSIVYTTHRVMNAILCEKFSLAESKNIEMDIYVEPSIPLDVILDGDMVIMLGNLLDNALEAVENIKDEAPFIKVRIYKENQGKICAIKIENPYLTPVTYNKKGLILTNKKEGLHGFGLKSVDETAKKYGGYLQCSHNDNLFTSLLILSLDKDIL